MHVVVNGDDDRDDFYDYDDGMNDWMTEWLTEWMDGWMDGWMNEQMNEWWMMTILELLANTCWSYKRAHVQELQARHRPVRKTSTYMEE